MQHKERMVHASSTLCTVSNALADVCEEEFSCRVLLFVSFVIGQFASTAYSNIFGAWLRARIDFHITVVVQCFIPPPNAGKRSIDAGHRPRKNFSHYASTFWADVKTVMSQRVYATLCFAYTSYVAVLGVYAFWGPQAGKQLFFPANDTSNQADMVFGGVTVITGA